MNILATNLSKRFNREWIFRKLNFNFSAGGTYALIGPNGSGKSTLLQILTGHMAPSDGTLTFENKGHQVPPDEVFNYISIAAPYMDLIDEFTIQEMVNFHFKFKKLRLADSKEDVIERMNLGHAKDKTISNFSSGMRQRLKLGLAFHSESSILFLDEPTTNLDQASFNWYWENLTLVLKQAIVIIASNQEAEYPSDAEKIDIMKYK